MTDTPDKYALIKAMQKNDLEAVKALLEAGADINAEDGATHWTPLTYAVTRNQEEIVRFLISQKADVDRVNREGNTALIQAAGSSLTGASVLNLLLDHYTDIDRQNKRGYTALALAVSYGRETMVDILLKRGASYTIPTYEGLTPLALAKKHNRGKIATLLTALHEQARHEQTMRTQQRLKEYARKHKFKPN